MPKLIIIDAGGVLHPDSELGLANQAGISLYPESTDMLRHLIATGYKIVVLTNNSDQHTKDLLAKAGLSIVTVYGSAEIGVTKPNQEAFLRVCHIENVKPEDCVFIDDREKNRYIAESLGMSVVNFECPPDSNAVARSVNDCMDSLVKLGIVYAKTFSFQELPDGINRGMYPSFIGMINGNIVRAEPEPEKETFKITITDKPNEDGNLRKHCLYESRLAKLICEAGQPYWKSAYHKINQLFLADFELKTRSPEQYAVYFLKVESALKKINMLDNSKSLYYSLSRLFSEDFDLANVSQFYFNFRGFEPYETKSLEPFVFLVDELKQRLPVATNNIQTLLILALCHDMAHDFSSRRLAYCLVQPYITCGPPQLRGRTKRGGDTQSVTIGILRDDDPDAHDLQTASHFAAKTAFQPLWQHPIAQEFQAFGAPIVGGPSGTLGRNVLMLAPLVESNLLTQEELMQYLMVFWADCVYRGHHSFEEVALMSSQLLVPLKAWLDPIRTPQEFYEQLLTPQFLHSSKYQEFLRQHKDFFDVEFNTPSLKA